MVNMASERYRLFAEKGIKCVTCGLEGNIFALEKNPLDTVYHFNLYAVDEGGNETLMTKDHIVPKSLGGPNRLDNYQTMCTKCNSNKGVGGLTLEQWKSRPANTLKVGAIEYILADWEQREKDFEALQTKFITEVAKEASHNAVEKAFSHELPVTILQNEHIVKKHPDRSIEVIRKVENSSVMLEKRQYHL